MKPSLQKELKAFVGEFRDAGFPVTQEMVLEALVRELRDNDEVRGRMVTALVEETK